MEQAALGGGPGEMSPHRPGFPRLVTPSGLCLLAIYPVSLRGVSVNGIVTVELMFPGVCAVDAVPLSSQGHLLLSSHGPREKISLIPPQTLHSEPRPRDTVRPWAGDTSSPRILVSSSVLVIN